MFPILVLIRPLDLVTKQRVDVRIGSAPSSPAMGLGGFEWEPAFAKTGRPSGSIELMSLDMSAGIRPATSTMKLATNSIRKVDAKSLYWVGAPITIYRADELVWPAPIEFDGLVTRPQLSLADGSLTLNSTTSARRLDVDLLTATFSGDGGEGGDPEKYGTLRPYGAGKCDSVEVTFFDTIRNIGQIDGYNNTIAIDALFEGGSDFGPSAGDYPTWGALAAAIDSKAVKEGQWATCIAQGLIGLGAPATGVITCNAQFRNGSPGQLLRNLMLVRAAVPAALVIDATLSALDKAVPFPLHYWTADQVKVKDVVELVADTCNAVPIVTFQGKFAVTRPFGGKTVATLTRDGYNEPDVTDWQVADPIDPIWQMKVRTARPVRVLGRDEILFEDDFVPRGLYDNGDIYRAGHTVWTDDGAEWLYINADPSAGHRPPADPVVKDAYWERLKPPTKEQLANSYAATSTYDPQANYAKGDQVRSQGARWIRIGDLAWDHATAPPQLPEETNAFWTLLRDASTATLKTTISAVTFQANYMNVPNDGQLPYGGRATLVVGSADVTGAVAWSVVTSGCDATIDADGSFRINAVRTSGYVDIRGVYNNKTYTGRVLVTLNAAAPPAGGGGVGPQSANITQFASVGTATYPAAPAFTAQVPATEAGLKFSASLNYSASPIGGGKQRGSATLFVKVVYRVAGSGSGWTDASGEEYGNEAYSNGSPDFDSQDGYLQFADILLSGLVTGTMYEFGIITRRVGNSATTPSGVVTGSGR